MVCNPRPRKGSLRASDLNGKGVRARNRERRRVRGGGQTGGGNKDKNEDGKKREVCETGLLPGWAVSIQSIHSICVPGSEGILVTRYQVTRLDQSLSGIIVGGGNFSGSLNCPSFLTSRGLRPSEMQRADSPFQVPCTWGCRDRSVSRGVKVARKTLWLLLFVQAQRLCCPVCISPSFLLTPTPDRLKERVKTLQHLFSC